MPALQLERRDRERRQRARDVVGLAERSGQEAMPGDRHRPAASAPSRSTASGSFENGPDEGGRAVQRLELDLAFEGVETLLATDSSTASRCMFSRRIVLRVVGQVRKVVVERIQVDRVRVDRLGVADRSSISRKTDALQPRRTSASATVRCSLRVDSASVPTARAMRMANGSTSGSGLGPRARAQSSLAFHGRRSALASRSSHDRACSRSAPSRYSSRRACTARSLRALMRASASIRRG